MKTDMVYIGLNKIYNLCNEKYVLAVERQRKLNKEKVER